MQLLPHAGVTGKPVTLTSLLRLDVPDPMMDALSMIMTSCPHRASSRAIASPTTPAPSTAVCTLAADMPVLVCTRHHLAAAAS